MEDLKETKNVTIFVEGTPHEWPKHSDISYADVVGLEFADAAQNPNATYAIKYTNAHGRHPGILVPNSSVTVKEGMVFNVSRTGQS